MVFNQVAKILPVFQKITQQSQLNLFYFLSKVAIAKTSFFTSFHFPSLCCSSWLCCSAHTILIPREGKFFPFLCSTLCRCSFALHRNSHFHKENGVQQYQGKDDGNLKFSKGINTEMSISEKNIFRNLLLLFPDIST